MDAFSADDVAAERARAGKLYLEFLRSESMSIGLYELPAGGVDPQRPHAEDEVYVVLGGRAQVHVGGDDRVVVAGDVVYVAAGVEHRFHSIEEDLRLVVVFAPPET
jgi:quercetin dioxygenase-like cupin family protein